ncbi:MAG: 16S rRNA (cytosine(967)-C(5))-methyltransferase RsmB [Micavibrio aeruginosavorus]|uniref:16S rRNA (cytosine(967)-C(5))-methyltransferase n=1 Tax=Micavibrio aeruginosavorus TaxID=349221 RepID=A0A7T5R393_9BACT|nr:MAG: 16S rRNA (cytosine(967)-C(5))-methyltransferase RsmB [Micavibrio aeruginosavorus]
MVPRSSIDSPPNSRNEALSARLVALQLLCDVLDKKTPLDQALDSMAAFRMLSARDRAFARMLVATTLRRLGQIDNLITRMSERATPPSLLIIHHILRLGATQIFFMDVPVYAAVDTAVRMAEEKGLARLKGFVNAILRRMDREGREIVNAQDEVSLNIPDWLYRIWVADYGAEEASLIAQALLAEAPLDITVKDQAMLPYWAAQLEGTIMPGGSIRRVAGGMVTDLPGYNEGIWWIQDLSASLPAKLLGDVKGRTVIDLCAAPGGKTAQLAVAGARVTALDRSRNRLRRLEENMKRLHLDVMAEAADATVWQPESQADFVLLDAPCSATGTIRRHPDVLHLKRPQDIDALADLQARLLERASSMLTADGVLIYCTCSLQKSEGEARIEAFLRAHPDMIRHPIRDHEIIGLEMCLTAVGDMRILPHHHQDSGGMDGFYICRLQKR